MLGELYKYALDNNLAVRPGFKEKNVKWYISFGADGSFIGFDAAADKPFCPDIGSLANGTTKSNIIAEKAEVILNLPDENGELKRDLKHTFYMESMKDAAQHDQLISDSVTALDRNLDSITKEFIRLTMKPSDVISIKYDGKPIESSSDYLEWWEIFRKSFDTKNSDLRKRCFITGELTEPMTTVPPFNGLGSVGGHLKGDSLICFDKDAYRSYGFEQAANASVSENAATGVNAALKKLLEDAPRLAGMKSIHWFSKAVENDLFEMLDFDFGWGDDDLQDGISDESDNKQADERKAQRLFKCIFDGTCPELPDNRYYMLSLSGVNGRVMIRSYDEGNYRELYESIRAWYNDLKIEGRGFPKMWRIYTRLLKRSNDNKKLSERIAKELSGLSPRIMYSILHNTPLPDTVAVKALAYIRSDMYSSDEDGKSKRKNLDTVSCQLLKAWLNRKYRNNKKEDFCIMDKLNNDSPSKAFHVGRLMSVYAALQKKALGDVGAGVVERYYTSACTAPALVIGKLATMSQYHLSKLDKGSYVFYSGMFQEISGKIGTSVPKTFSLEEQSEFALGYYFQNSEIYKKTNKKTEE